MFLNDDIVYWMSKDEPGLYRVIQTMTVRGRPNVRLQALGGGRYKLAPESELAMVGARLVSGVEVKGELFEVWELPNGGTIIVNSEHLELHGRVAYDCCTKEGPFYLAEIDEEGRLN